MTVETFFYDFVIDVYRKILMTLRNFTRSLYDAHENLEEREKLAFLCSCAIDSVKAGGSVIIPINRLGIVLQLLEQISALLDSSNLKVDIIFLALHK